MDTYTVISAFSGIGGLDLGVSAAIPTRTICYIEREITCARVLAQRAEEGLLDDAPIYSDVKTFPTELFAGKVDILIGGFPCQPFSVAGKQEGSEDERNLWPDTLRLIRSLRPRYAFMENVPGLVSHEYFGTILGDLAEAGYDAEWGCFTASEIGASHRRERVFILAHSNQFRPGGGDRGLEFGQVPINRFPTDQTQGSGSELAHADSRRSFKEQSAPINWQDERTRSKHESSEVAHANSDESSTQSRNDGEIKGVQAKEWTEHSPSLSKRGSKDMAHANSGFSNTEGKEICTRGESLELGGNELADPAVTGLEGEEHRVSRDASESSRELGNPYEQGLQGRYLGTHDRGEGVPVKASTELGELPEFPPGPGDSRWGWIIEHYPELSPALCKVHEAEPTLCNMDDAGKITDRVAALMMLGNAVVPQQAEHAFRTLASRINDAR